MTVIRTKPTEFTLPPAQIGHSVWYGPQLDSQRGEWVITCKLAEIDEIKTALQHFKLSGETINRLSADLFPLKTLGNRLRALRQQLIEGIGFFVLRGFPSEEFTEEENAIVFAGIGSYLGNFRSQNKQRHLIGHVRDAGLSSENPEVRIYQTNERQSFHTDSSDAVGLFCLQCAKEGGDSLLVSSGAVYNELLAQRPDLAKLLLAPIATDRRGEVPKGELPYLLIPVLSYYEGKLTPFYQRQYIDSAQRFEDAPRLTEEQKEALDLFDALCNSPDLHLRMTLQPGDMQFVYNHSLLHDRTAFVDWPDPAKRRHLLRLWLSLPDDRPLPDIFATRFGSVEIGNRGGIITS